MFPYQQSDLSTQFSIHKHLVQTVNLKKRKISFESGKTWDSLYSVMLLHETQVQYVFHKTKTKQKILLL